VHINTVALCGLHCERVSERAVRLTFFKHTHNFLLLYLSTFTRETTTDIVLDLCTNRDSIKRFVLTRTNVRLGCSLATTIIQTLQPLSPSCDMNISQFLSRNICRDKQVYRLTLA